MTIKAVQNMETLLANCDEWRSITSTATEAAAKDTIHIHALENPTPPYCILSNIDSTMEQVGTNTWQDSGTIGIRLVLARTNTGTLEAEMLTIQDSLDTLVSEIQTNQGTNGWLSVQSVTFPPIMRSNFHQNPERWELEGEVNWPEGVG